MAKKEYNWSDGAVLEDHTKKKHEILKEYFRNYLITRCQLPQQERFRVAIVDGFAGGGLYSCGAYGSPLIFVETVAQTTREINLARIDKGLKAIKVDCSLVLNDSDPEVVNQLEKNISPLVAASRENTSHFEIKISFHRSKFEDAYPSIKNYLIDGRWSNVFFNLDQCGYSQVTTNIIKDITCSWRSSEVLLTFMIGSLLAYLSPSDKSKVPLEKDVREKINDLLINENHYSKNSWLAETEKIAFDSLKSCATYVSPFSINNPSGWRYWLMHFANSYRARQVYNNVLHNNAGSQAHFGRAGLHMLSYDPAEEGCLYLFDDDSRQLAKESLFNDIPRLVSASGDVMSMEGFYASSYSETPAHSDDIHEMIIENPDLEVVTSQGGLRKKASTIQIGDFLRICNQRSLFFMYSKE